MIVDDSVAAKQNLLLLSPMSKYDKESKKTTKEVSKVSPLSTKKKPKP